MYSAYKLNKQGDNIQPYYTLFPNFEPVSCSMSSSNCYFFAYIQASQETSKMVWYSHLIKNFPVCVCVCGVCVCVCVCVCDLHSERI